MFKDVVYDLSALYKYTVIDDDGFEFGVNFGSIDDWNKSWRAFFQDFVAGYEKRGIDPFPNLLKYLDYKLTDPSWDKYIEILKETLPQYKDRIEKIMVLL